jgi:acetyltransferase
MLDAFKAFSLPLTKGNRLALITRSGGHGVLAGDAAHRHGFVASTLSDGFFDLVKSKKINVIRTTNPVDVGDVYSLNAYSEIIEKALQEKDVDGVAFVATFSSETDGLAMKEALRRTNTLMQRYEKPVVFCMVTNKNQWFPMKEVSDFPTFTDVDEALKALALSREHFKRLGKETFGRKKMSFARHVHTLKPSGSSGMMDASSSFSLLREYGIDVADYAVVKTAEEALKKAQEIGYPVALKNASPSMLHKTEQGGVVLNIRNALDLRKAIKKINADDYLIQEMAPAGIEVIIGGKKDREFGPVILIGLGGIFVEVYKDTALRVAPIDEAMAEELLGEINGSALLKGFRGLKLADFQVLVKTLVNISNLLMDHPEITNLDINPLIVLEKGKGCVAVDIKMQVDGQK